MVELVPAHMIPRHISLVERIPFTVGGKIDRRAVAGELAAAVSGSAEPGHRAPSTPLESALAAIVGDVLGVRSVGADDDFFALGGDSVLATQTVARIRAWLDTPDVHGRRHLRHPNRIRACRPAGPAANAIPVGSTRSPSCTWKSSTWTPETWWRPSLKLKQCNDIQ